jgi:hypothetical protein
MVASAARVSRSPASIAGRTRPNWSAFIRPSRSSMRRSGGSRTTGSAHRSSREPLARRTGAVEPGRCAAQHGRGDRRGEEGRLRDVGENPDHRQARRPRPGQRDGDALPRPGVTPHTLGVAMRRQEERNGDAALERRDDRPVRQEPRAPRDEVVRRDAERNAEVLDPLDAQVGGKATEHRPGIEQREPPGTTELAEHGDRAGRVLHLVRRAAGGNPRSDDRPHARPHETRRAEAGAFERPCDADVCPAARPAAAEGEGEAAGERVRVHGLSPMRAPGSRKAHGASCRCRGRSRGRPPRSAPARTDRSSGRRSSASAPR